MKSAIKQEALRLGFDDCRVTTAQAPGSGDRFAKWLKEGRHGEMDYLERNAQKRMQPQLVLPGARSILTLAVSYAKAEDAAPGAAGAGGHHLSASDSQIPSPPMEERGRERRSNKSEFECERTSRLFTGVVARYAQYTDYHKVLGERLKQLCAFITHLAGPSVRSLWYVDTGPVLERDLAERAGIGFIGKHTNVISRRLGNWIFLAEILTTMELEPDSAETNLCGSCEKCIQACPTGAITGPFQLDARRCISYLTIELKGPIPTELRPLLGNRIYGCDDCLAVCPWNRFAQEGSMMKGEARKELAIPDLLELLNLDEAGFRARFAGTPIVRAKRQGLLRNVCVALGNVGDERALPALERNAAGNEPLIAEHARWACEQIRERVTNNAREMRHAAPLTVS